VHHLFVRKIAVGEEDQIDLQAPDERSQFVLGKNWNIGIVERTSQFLPKAARLDERNLGCSEGDHVKFRTVAEEHQKIVKVTVRPRLGRYIARISPSIRFSGFAKAAARSTTIAASSR